MDATAYNYNSLANTSDVCYYNPGCTNVGYLEYYTQGFVADVDDGSCSITAVFGCIDMVALRNTFNSLPAKGANIGKFLLVEFSDSASASCNPT